MKYLLLDHMGVLNQALMPDGEINKTIVNLLNELTANYGYTLLFHSSNSLAGQLDLLKKLREAASKKHLAFPFVAGLAVCDPIAYGAIPSTPPFITIQPDGLKIAVYGIRKSGKSCMREALSSMFGISRQDRAHCIVLDDNGCAIQESKKEGYGCKYIQPNGLTFEQALQEVVALEKGKLDGLS